MKILRISLFVSAIVFACVFAYSVMMVLELRFAKGDVHPQYSSFRCDPFGAKALLRTLELCGAKVSRNYRPISEIESPKDKTLLVLGAGYDAISPFGNLDADLYAFASKGGRLVLMLDDGYFTLFGAQEKSSCKGGKCKIKDDNGKDDDDKEDDFEPSAGSAKSRLEKFSVGVNIRPSKKNKGSEDEQAHPVANFATRFKSFKIFSENSLKLSSEKWTSVYERDGKVVMAERKLGAGSIVLCTNSYPLSNEALSKDIDPELIAWICGSSSGIVFDEFFKGMRETRNIFWLAKKSRLGYFAVGLTVLALLLLWRRFWDIAALRNSQKASRNDILVASSYGVSKGLENILRATLKKEDLISACVEEWRRSAPLAGAGKETINAVSSIADADKKRPPLAIYGEISKLIKDRKYGGKHGEH